MALQLLTVSSKYDINTLREYSMAFNFRPKNTAEITGKKKKFSSLPAQLALKSRCKIFLGWPIRKNDGKYEFEIHQSIHASDYEDTSDNVEKISEIIIAYYESMIKKYPEQYFWFHNRWKLD